MSLKAEIASYRGLFDRRVWLLTYGQALQSLGRGVLMPFATLYFYNVQGFPLVLIGLALAIAFPLGAITGLAWGALADRYGRKPLMVFGYAAHAVTTAMLAFVETVPQYFVVVVLNSVSVAAWIPASRAMIADVTPPARRTRAFGLNYMANNLGLSVGLVVGGALALLLPYRALFFAESIGSLAYLLVVLFFVQESWKPEQRAREAGGEGPLARVAHHLRDVSTPLRDRTFVVFGLAIIFAGLGYSQFYVVWSPYLSNVIGAGDAWIAIVFAVNTVMVIALQIPIAHWAEKRRRTYVFILGAYLMASSLLLTWAAGRVGALTPALTLMVSACILLTLQEIALAPVIPALSAALARTPERVGKYMAGMELTFAFNAGIGAVIGGIFFDAGRPHLLWPWMTALALLSIGGYLWLAKLLPPEVNEPAMPQPPTVTAAGDGAALG